MATTHQTRNVLLLASASALFTGGVAATPMALWRSRALAPAEPIPWERGTGSSPAELVRA